MKTTLQKISRIGLLASAVTLAACGGGSSSTPLTVSGVAATGWAIAGASVTVQCAAGAGTATTSTSGAYTVTVDGQGPCLVTLTQGSLTLLSITPKTTTGTATANLTPFSDAIVKALMQAKGASTPAGLVTTAIPTNANLIAANTAAIAKINAALKAAGKPVLADTTDLLGQANFVARTLATPAGDAQDQALDALVVANALPTTLVADIKTDVSKVVTPNPTGATGAGG